MARDANEPSIIAVFKAAGWKIYKTHGSMYAYGWPDLYIMHKEFQPRWVEIKMPGQKLRASQRELFLEWMKYGTNVWVIDSPVDWRKIFEPPNWGMYI